MIKVVLFIAAIMAGTYIIGAVLMHGACRSKRWF